MVHFFEADWTARNTTFSADPSLGNSLRRWVALRITLFSDSMALVV